MCSLFEYVPEGGASGSSGIRAAESSRGVIELVERGRRGPALALSLTALYGRMLQDEEEVRLLQDEEEVRLLQDEEECCSLSRLMECGEAVNSPGDALGQTPAHLAARGGQAFFLLWQLQTGVDVNQQDFFGETLIHKAAHCGSLECLSVLVAHDARLDVCNKDGLTAEALALSRGFVECAKYLATVRHTQDTFYGACSSMQHCKETTAAIKRRQCDRSAASGKRRRSDGFL